MHVVNNARFGVYPKRKTKYSYQVYEEGEALCVRNC